MNAISDLSNLQCNNLETVLIASKWVNTDLMEIHFFLLEYNDSEEFYHRYVSFKSKCEESNEENIFSYNFLCWPVGMKSCYVVLKFRNCANT